MCSKILGVVGGESSGSFLISILLDPYATSHSLEHLLSICFLLGASMYNVSCNLPNSPVQ